MGKSETSSAILGYKIKISKLIEQLSLDNKEIVISFLEEGFIEDENEDYNSKYMDVIDFLRGYIKALDEEKENDEKYIQKIKDVLIDELKNNGNIIHLRDGGCKHDISTPLYEMDLLIPLKTIHETTRWGYDRYGDNGTSIPINSILEDVNKLKIEHPIKNLELVFIIKQSSG